MKVHINRGDLFCLLYNPVPLLIALLELYVGNITGKVGLNPMTTLNMTWVEVYRMKLNLKLREELQPHQFERFYQYQLCFHSHHIIILLC